MDKKYRKLWYAENYIFHRKLCKNNATYKLTDRKTNRNHGKMASKQTKWQKDRNTDKYTDRQTDKQTDRGNRKIRLYVENFFWHRNFENNATCHIIESTL